MLPPSDTGSAKARLSVALSQSSAICWKAISLLRLQTEWQSLLMQEEQQEKGSKQENISIDCSGPAALLAHMVVDVLSFHGRIRQQLGVFGFS
jgi:hypothetical protein